VSSRAVSGCLQAKGVLCSTATMYVLQNGNLECIKTYFAMLAAAGDTQEAVDMSIKDNDGRSAIHHLVVAGHMQVRFLLVLTPVPCLMAWIRCSTCCLSSR